jgi:phospholipase C
MEGIANWEQGQNQGNGKLSAWRRAAVGDLTSALDFKKPDTSIPNAGSTLPAIQQEIQECVANLAGTTPYIVPSNKRCPAESPGAIRPSVVC